MQVCSLQVQSNRAGTFMAQFGVQADAEEAVGDGHTTVNTATANQSVASKAQSGSLDFTIPLHISVKVGDGCATEVQVAAPQQTGSGSVADPEAQEAIFSFFRSRGRRKQPASNFINRFSITALQERKFDWNAALACGLASHLAYEMDGEKVERIAKDDFKFDECKFVTGENTECFLAWNDEVGLLSFRGTQSNSLSDWLTDLDVRSVKRHYGRVHRGFLNGFRAVSGQLEPLLHRISDRKLTFTGHSLGGALATVAAAEWQMISPATMVYTFGQPAVGKRKCRDFLNAKYAGQFYRIVNDDDIVSMVPPGFKHVGKLIHFDSDGNTDSILQSMKTDLDDRLRSGETMNEETFDRLKIQLLTDRIKRREDAGNKELIPSVSDHSMDLYVTNVAGKAT